MKKLISLILTIMLLAGNVPAFAEDAPAHVLVVYFSTQARITTLA